MHFFFIAICNIINSLFKLFLNMNVIHMRFFFLEKISAVRLSFINVNMNAMNVYELRTFKHQIL